jgi:hypothetical protein
LELRKDESGSFFNMLQDAGMQKIFGYYATFEASYPSFVAGR